MLKIKSLFANDNVRLNVNITLLFSLAHFFFVIINECIYNAGITPDSITYLKTAKNYLQFDFFQIQDNWKSAPGYPLFLALFTLLGKLNWVSVVLVQCLIHFFSLLF